MLQVFFKLKDSFIFKIGKMLSDWTLRARLLLIECPVHGRVSMNWEDWGEERERERDEGLSKKWHIFLILRGQLNCSLFWNWLKLVLILFENKNKLFPHEIERTYMYFFVLEKAMMFISLNLEMRPWQSFKSTFHTKPNTKTRNISFLTLSSLYLVTLNCVCLPFFFSHLLTPGCQS